MGKLFAGLDVADQTTAICVLDHAGQTVLEQKVATSPDAIARALAPYRRSLKVVGQESGSKANWLHKELRLRRLPLVCLDARYTHAALSARGNKTDKNDARGIAEVLQRGMYSQSYVKSDEALRIRLLLTYRKILLRKALSIQLTLQMSVKMFGAYVEERENGPHVVYAKDTDTGLEVLNQTLVRARGALLAEVAHLDRLVVRAAKADEVCRRLMTIPSVGPIAALSFRAAIDDPHRFPSSRTVGAYLGLAPRTYQSGETEVRGRISKRGDMSARSALYNSATVLLSISKTTWPLRAWGRKLAERRGFKFAAVACARRLAVVMHRVWVTGTEFEKLSDDAMGPSARESRKQRCGKLWKELASSLAHSNPALATLATPATPAFSFSAGRRHFYFVLEANQRRAGVHIEIRGSAGRRAFDVLLASRRLVEAEVGTEIAWERRDGLKYPRLSIWREGVDPFAEETKPDLFAWYQTSLAGLGRAVAIELS